MGRNMRYQDKIEKLLADTKKCAKTLGDLISDTEDIDLQRILKKIDAHLMDAQHNLVLAKKLAEEKIRH
jgi:hypothetical protein